MKIIHLNRYRNRSKVIQFPLSRTTPPAEPTMNEQLERIRESINKINTLMAEVRERNPYKDKKD